MKKPQKLTEKQEKFIEAFLGECHLDPIKAYEAAGYAHSFNKYSESMKVLNSDSVVREINQRMADKDTSYWINDSIIIKKLWEEATNPDSPAAARINSLVWIGKHIGMWKEKEQEADKTPQINIIQYGMDKEVVEKELNKPEVVSAKDKVSLPEGVQVTNYSEEDESVH
ncbi:MAG: terminase small subunit [Gammaproteobacteria bacterium]|nr:terminase small subunit [Gammaproteobacteria bacterium]